MKHGRQRIAGVLSVETGMGLGRWVVVLSIAMLGGLMITASHAYAATYRVGAGGIGAGCAFGSIEAAVAVTQGDGDEDVLLVANNILYDDDLVIIGSDRLTIEGGYSSCTDITQSGRTAVVGNVNAANPTLLSTANDLTLRHLDLFGSADVVLDVSSGNTVLENSLVRGGSTGVIARNGSEVTIDVQTIVNNNTSTTLEEGGGISCHGGSTVLIHGDVTFNSAVEGGGVRASSNCFVQIFPGTFIAGNSATRGGGVYLEQGAFLGGGGGIERAFVNGNEADEGGAFFVIDAGSRASVFNTEILENEARFLGGGVMATNGGEFSMNRSTTVACGNAPRCSRLSDNALTQVGSEYGTAAFAASGGKVTLHQTYVEGNSGPTEGGRLLHAEDAGSELVLEAVQLWNNKATWLLSATQSATAQAAFISAARNEWLVGGSTYSNSNGADGSSGGQVRFYNSALQDTAGFAGTVTSDCGIFDTVNGLSNQFFTAVGDPQFVSADAGDLHLRPSSPAIDYCDTLAFTPTRLDVDLDQRGYDRPGVDHGVAGGLMDLGVDEAVGLFWDGFESGDTSSWSSTTP